MMSVLVTRPGPGRKQSRLCGWMHNDTEIPTLISSKGYRVRAKHVRFLYL